MIIIPNGGAPEKVEYFSDKSNCKLFDNEGDNSNKKLFDNLSNILNEGDKILITSEEQLGYLSTLPFNTRSEILSRCIYMKSELNDDPFYLCNKGLFAKLPNLGKTSKLVHKDNLDEFKSESYVIKELVSSGSRGVHISSKIGNIDPNQEFNQEWYLIQEKCNIDSYYNYTIPVIIKDYKLKHFIPILGDEGTYFMSKWRSLHIDGTCNKVLIPAINEIIDTFKIIEGVAEFEIYVNKYNNSMTLIDLNPRWSYDNSTCTKFVRNSGLKDDYDHLNGIFDDTTFFVPDNFVGPKFQLCERYKVCKNFSHI